MIVFKTKYICINAIVVVMRQSDFCYHPAHAAATKQWKFA